MYNFMNPYQTQQRQEVIKVNGENGARAYQIGANSSALLLDINEPLIWFVQTDGAGYKSITAYDIALHVPEEPVKITDLEARIVRLEEALNESYIKSAEATASKQDKSTKKYDERKPAGNIQPSHTDK